jgi:DNA-nicking Smr family endonuclease
MAKDLKQKAVGGDNRKFAVRPFSAIKGIAVEKSPDVPKPAVVPAPKRESGSPAEDDLLFLTEMAGVTRIHSHASKRKIPEEKSRSEKAQISSEPEDSRLFLDALKEMKLDVRFADSVPENEAPLPLRQVSRMRQLRRGTIRLNLEIDLHGLTRDEAIDALALFIAAAGRRGQQAVLVITGKGAHSPGEPVLQGAVADWLLKEGKEWVVEFVPAPQNLGGDGAYVVFFKT